MSEHAVSLRNRKLVQIGLTVRDLDAARVFYRDVLELTLQFEVPNMLFFDLGGQRLLIGTQAGEHPDSYGSILYFDAPDLDALAARLEARGVRFSGPAVVLQRTATHELKLRDFRDPEGNSLALMGLVALG